MSKKQDSSPSKRQVLKEQRAKKQRQQRLFVIGGIVVVALLFILLLALPSIQEAATPVGAIATITSKGLEEKGDATLGDPNAPVKIEVFEDFQCPACRTYSETIEPRIIDSYVTPGKVYYVFRQFPFIDDKAPTKESDQAANSSLCAAEQKRFWDYHDMLFANWNGENQGSFSDRRLKAFAETLKLDMNAFNTCFAAKRFQQIINAGLADGQRLGVTGTPSVFVNGTQITPGFIPSYEEIQKAVEAALAP